MQSIIFSAQAALALIKRLKDPPPLLSDALLLQPERINTITSRHRRGCQSPSWISNRHYANPPQHRRPEV